MEQEKANINMDAVAQVAEFLFLTEQMGWKKGLKIFHEQGKDAMESELNRYMTWKDSSPSTGTNSPRRNEHVP